MEECICMKNTPENCNRPIGIEKDVEYNSITNYHYEGHRDEEDTRGPRGGGYTCSYERVNKHINVYLRVRYPYLWETDVKYDGSEYLKRLFHCPLCGRLFPPQTWFELQDYAVEKGIGMSDIVKKLEEN